MVKLRLKFTWFTMFNHSELNNKRTQNPNHALFYAKYVFAVVMIDVER